MIPPVISRFLTLRPLRTLIQRANGIPVVSSAFRKISGASRIFSTLDEASAAARLHRPDTFGHLDANLIDSNFLFSSAIRLSDYPVLFWLREISVAGTLNVFDFGGGVGQTFVALSHYLKPEVIGRWIVQDLPDVVSDAPEKYYPTGTPAALEFTSTMSHATDCNVVLAAGAFHYWEGSIANFFAALSTKPDHFIINRSPMRSTGEPFYTVQEGTNWAVPCKVNSVDSLISEMKREGYVEVDRWIDLEKSLILPLYPDHSTPYRGIYFRRDSLRVALPEDGTEVSQFPPR
jgi:putative methyltransferase (TIGR04325 family)